MQETEFFMQLGALIGYVWGLIVALFTPKIISVIKNSFYNKKQQDGTNNNNQ